MEKKGSPWGRCSLLDQLLEPVGVTPVARASVMDSSVVSGAAKGHGIYRPIQMGGGTVLHMGSGEGWPLKTGK